MSEIIGSLNVTDNLAFSGSDLQTGITTHTLPKLLLKDFPNANGWLKQLTGTTATLAASNGVLQLRGGSDNTKLNTWIHRSMRAKNGIWRYRFSRMDQMQVMAVQDASNLVGITKSGDDLIFLSVVNNVVKDSRLDGSESLRMNKVGDRYETDGGTNLNILFDWTKPGEIIVARYDDFFYFAILEENGRLVRTLAFTSQEYNGLELNGFGVGKTTAAANVDIIEAEFTGVSEKGLQRFIALGDSQTWGQIGQYVTGSAGNQNYTYPGLGRGFVNELYQYMKGNNKIISQNGQPAATTQDILDDLDKHMTGLHKNVNTTVMLYIGVNDTFLTADDGATIFSRWLRIAQDLTARVGVQKVLAFTIPMVTVRTTGWPRNAANVNAWNARLRILNELIVENAADIGYEVYDIAQIAQNPTDDNAVKPGYIPNNDGIHFTELTHIEFAKSLRPQTVRRVKTGENIGGDLAAVAESFTQALDTKLAAQRSDIGESQLATTDMTVLQTTFGTVQIGSCADGNVVEVYQTGEDRAAGRIKSRHFMVKGELLVIKNLKAGSVISSTKGVNGVSGVQRERDNRIVSPFPLAPSGMAGRNFFIYMFRDSANGGGRIYVAAGAVPAIVRLSRTDASDPANKKVVPVGSPTKIPAYGIVELRTDVNNAEYNLTSDQNVFVGVLAAMTGNPQFKDARLVPPLATELIGHAGSARVSALYEDTTFDWYAMDGRSGTGVKVAPGEPVELFRRVGAGTSDYNQASLVLVKASAPISAFSGADGGGNEATPYYPLNMLSQVIPLPMSTKTAASNARNATSSILVASPYQGTARIYQVEVAVNAQTGVKTVTETLVATLTLKRRTGGTVISDPTKAQQEQPCTGMFGVNGSQSDVRLAADFKGGYVEADVPIYVVMNSDQNETITQDGIRTNDDEVALWGMTPSAIETEIGTDVNGQRRRQEIAADGSVSWKKT